MSLVLHTNLPFSDCSKKVQRLASYSKFLRRTSLRYVIFAEAGFHSDTDGIPKCFNCNWKFENISHNCINRKDVCLQHATNSPNCDVAKECLQEFTKNSQIKGNQSSSFDYAAENTRELIGYNNFLKVDYSSLNKVQNNIVDSNESCLNLAKANQPMAADNVLHQISPPQPRMTNVWDQPTTSTRNQRGNNSIPFKIENSTSTLNPERLTNAESKDDFDFEFLRHCYMSRLKTFENWPKESPVNPSNLAKDGFIYIGEKDMTKCVFCFGVLSNWEAGDVPELEHAKFMPRCVRNCGSGNHGNAHKGKFSRFEEDLNLTKSEQFPVKDHTFNKLKEEEEGCSNGANKKSTKSQYVMPEEILKKIKSLKVETETLKERKLCKICLDTNVDTVLLPCGHLVSCKRCAPKINTCPICRTIIRGTVLAFIPD